MSDFQRLNLNNIQNPSLRRVCQVTRQTPLELWSTFAELCNQGSEPKGLHVHKGTITYHRYRCRCQRPIYQPSWDSVRIYQREVDPAQLPDEGTTMNPRVCRPRVARQPFLPDP